MSGPPDPGTHPGAPIRRLPIGRRLALLARCFLLQGSWSYERMQSVGFGAAMAGEGRRLAAGPDAAAFLRRHLDFFNTNPTMASYIVGGTVRLEEDLAAGRAGEDEVHRFKRGLAGPLASLGDALFWGTLRPVASAAAVCAAALGMAWAGVVYLVAYNAFHLYYRVRGIGEGYRLGPEIARNLPRSRLKTLPGLLRPAGLALAGMALGLTGVGLARAAASPVVAWVAAGLFVLAFWSMVRRGGVGSWWGVAAVGVTLALGWAGVLAGR